MTPDDLLRWHREQARWHLDRVREILWTLPVPGGIPKKKEEQKDKDA